MNAVFLVLTITTGVLLKVGIEWKMPFTSPREADSEKRQLYKGQWSQIQNFFAFAHLPTLF